MTDSYPDAAGHSDDDTSIAAAQAITPDANRLRQMCCDELYKRELTTDETAALLGIDILTIRPRFSELRVDGRIEATGKKRRNESNRPAKVWRIRRDKGSDVDHRETKATLRATIEKQAEQIRKLESALTALARASRQEPSSKVVVEPEQGELF
jgi:predicted ArsR family transcriptional regulator